MRDHRVHRVPEELALGCKFVVAEGFFRGRCQPTLLNERGDGGVAAMQLSEQSLFVVCVYAPEGLLCRYAHAIIKGKVSLKVLSLEAFLWARFQLNYLI